MYTCQTARCELNKNEEKFNTSQHLLAGKHVNRLCVCACVYRDCVCHSIHEYIKILFLQNDWVEINMTYWNGCMSMLHRMKTKQNQKNYKTANTLSAAERKRIFFNIGFLSSPAHRFSERYISERETQRGPVDCIHILLATSSFAFLF